MTVIIRAITEGGFAIAADGLLTDADKITAVAKNIQKIFPVSSTNGKFALSFCGGRVVCSVDLIDAFRDSASALAPDSITDFRDYLARLCAPVKLALEDCEFHPQDGSFDEDKPGRTVAEVFLDGYLEGCPRCGAIRLFHLNQKIQAEVTEGLLPHLPIIHGSEFLTDALYGAVPDLRFLHYRVPLASPLRVETVVRVARRYIDACADPLAIDSDDFCLSVGGRLHAATVTRDAGFQWVTGFEPVV